MNASKRVFVNTAAQYIRTIINVLLSLYVVRVVLDTLGAEDYGIYTLVAGVVSMLSFITNALVNTTQRYISYNEGKRDSNAVETVFNNSMFIHILLGALVCAILIIIKPYLFNGFLEIDKLRLDAAAYVYLFVVIILFLSFITSPYRALLISHENIVYISVIDILDGVLKVILVFFMTNTIYDKLIFYGLSMLVIQLFNFFSLAVYSHIKYTECKLLKLANIKWDCIKELLGFAGWNVYATGCQVGRQQGVAIVINKLMGAAVNAAYGIGFQVAGYMSFLSTSIINAIAPQIIKAEGEGDRSKSLWLSMITSKMVFYLLSALCIPCIFEINSILQLWLKDVPQYTGLFCQMVLLTLIFDAISLGLTYLNNAIGKIGLYSFIMNTPKLLTLPIFWLLLKMDFSMITVVLSYAVIELLCSIGRILFTHYRINLDLTRFIKDVLISEFIPAFICVIICLMVSIFWNFQYRFVMTFVVSVVAYGFAIWAIGLNKDEKAIILNMVRPLLNKKNNENTTNQ